MKKKSHLFLSVNKTEPIFFDTFSDSSDYIKRNNISYSNCEFYDYLDNGFKYPIRVFKHPNLNNVYKNYLWDNENYDDIDYNASEFNEEYEFNDEYEFNEEYEFNDDNNSYNENLLDYH